MKKGNNAVISALISARSFVTLQDIIEKLNGTSISSFVGGVITAILALPEEAIIKWITASDEEKLTFVKQATD